MPIEVDQITFEQPDKIIQMQEGHFVDLKSKRIAPSKLTKHLSAFANADGGEIFIGIEEDVSTQTRVWDGFVNVEAANSHIQVFEEVFPLGEEFQYTFLGCSKLTGIILRIEVHKTRAIKKDSSGNVFLRRGAQSIPVNTDSALAKLNLDKGITSFETELVSMDLNLVSNSENIIKFMLEIIPTAEPEPWLRKQRLIINEKPSVAGILLFAEEPQAALPKRCAIKIYRYRTTEKVGTRETLAFDPITIEGCIYEQIKNSVQRTAEIIQGMKILTTKGLENPKYPLEALHEIITNAVLHRDYSITDDVHIRIFDNRVEVESPGILPGHITVENILDERFARNGTLVRLINKFPDPPNKDVGEGLNTAFQEMRKLKLKAPEIIQKDNSVLVVIKHEPLASAAEIIMEYLEHAEEINNSKARELCFIGSENVMKRVFERLIENNLIEPVPGKRGKAYAYRKKINI